MTIRWTAAIATAASVAAVAVFAHTGATGVVLERMNGMTAMRDVVSDLAPIMEGYAAYDAIVSEGAGVIAMHAGETMQSLFTEGSIEGATYAKPEIWSDWQDFAALAEDLKTYADALSVAAANGLEPAPAAGMAGMAHSGMVMPVAQPEDKAFTVAELMGYAERSGEARVWRGATEPTSRVPDLTTLAANDLFARISATCSSCHAQFRAGRS